MRKISFLLIIFLVLAGAVRAQTTTAVFEAESAGSTSFTDNGVIFNIYSKVAVFDIGDYPQTGWNGTVNDNRFIDNSGSVNLFSSFSIKTTSNLFQGNRFWVFLADAYLNQNKTGTLTITGRLNGVTKFTQTKSTGFATELGLTNGFTLIELTNLNGQNYSNIIIDELVLTIGGDYAYLALDAFTWVKDSGTVLKPGGAPAVATSAGTTAFTSGTNVAGTPVAIDPGITVSDPEDATLVNAKVSITGNLHIDQDLLIFSNDPGTMDNISGFFNEKTGELFLTSPSANATLAQWQTALRSVTYGNSFPIPNNSNRTLSFSVNDGVFNSTVATKTVSVNANVIAPRVVSIVREDGAAGLTNAASVNYTLTFSEAVTGVNISDFRIATTGIIIGPIVSSLIGSGDTYTITVNTGTGSGNIRLDLISSGTGIASAASGNNISGGYTSGQSYTVDKTLPTVPILTIASNNSNPQIARTGDVVTLSFLASEFFRSISVSVNGNPVIAYSTGVSSYSAIYTITAADPEGPLIFIVNFSDPVGNVGSQTATTDGSKVTVDNTPTTITSVSTTTADGTYPIGTVIPITINFTEKTIVTGTPTLSLNISIGATAVYTGGSGTTALDFSYTVAAGHSSSQLDYTSVSSLNLSGGSINDESNTPIDLTLPAPGAVGSLADGRIIVINGIAPTVLSIVRKTPTISLTNATSVEYTVTFSEAVTGVDVTDFQMSIGSTQTSSITSVVGSGSTYTVNVNTGTGNGTISINLKTSGTGITNLASNPIQTGLGPSQIYTIDKTIPTLSSVGIQSNRPGNGSIAIPGDIITLSFTSSETITMPVVSINGNTVTALNPTSNNWVASYTTLATDNNGQIPFHISYSDLAGNAGTPSTTTTNATSVTYDKTAPTLTVVSIASNNVSYPAYAKVGSMVTLFFTALESITSPTVTIGGATVTALPAGGYSWMAMYAIPSSLVEGEIPFTIDYRDHYGNNGTTRTTVTTGTMVTLDKTTPTISNVSIASNNPNPALAKPGDAVTVTFTASEGIQSPGVFFYGSASMSIVPQGNNVWTGTGVLSALNTEGAVPFEISYSDFAGNAGVAISTTNDASIVTYDKTPPVAPNFLGVTPGDTQNTMTWFLNVDYAKYELIGGAPVVLGNTVLTTVLAANATNPMTFPQTGLTNFTTYYYALRVTDAAGNATTSSTASGTPLNGQTITFDQPVAAEYGSSFTINATSSSGLPVILTSNEPALATISGNTVTIVGVNSLQSVSIFATQPGNANYSNAPPVIRVLQIKPKPVTVRATAQSKVFGGLEPAIAAPTVSPALIGTDVSTGVLARVSGENAGNYEIQQNNFSLDQYKYAITYAPANFTINKKIVTINPVAHTKIYNQNDPWLNFIIDVPGVPVTGALTRAAGEDVGSYAYDIGSMTVGSNYLLALNPTRKFTITPLTISVTATAGSKQYGDTEPLLAYTHSPALKSGDSFSGILKRVSGELPRIYSVSQGTLALSANYQLNYNLDPVNFTVLKKDINIIPTVGQRKVYGELDGTITYASSPALLNGDTFSGALDRAPGSAVNSYSIGIGTLVASNPQNYNLQLNTENYAITKKAIQVIATAVSQVYGDADPISLPYTLSAPLAAGDVFAGKLGRTAGTDVGTYPINSGNLSLSTNYDLSFTLADLSITPKAIAITAVSSTKTYGDADPVFGYTGSPALVNGDLYSGKLGRVVGEDVGNYALSLGDLKVSNNYTLTLNPGPVLQIGKKDIAVLAAAKSKAYGSTDPELTYTSSPALVSADTFTGALSRAPGEDVNTYVIGKGDLALSSNYTLNYTPANFSIGLQTINVTAIAKSKVYGEADPTLEYSFSPALKAGDTFTGALTRKSGTQVGIYQIEQGNLALNTNYTLNYTTGSLTVIKAALTITALNKEKFAGTANPVLTVSYSGFVNGESEAVLTTAPTLTTTALTTSPIGNYPIIASGATAANYSIDYVNGVLTIKPGAPTSVNLAAVTLFENRPIGTNAGVLSSTSDDSGATFTYTLIAGTGDTDNASFAISGNSVNTAAVLDYETKATYNIRVRSTTQYGFSLDKVITINVTDVNEVPTLATIGNQTICYTRSSQNVALTGISGGPETSQSPTLSVSSNNPALFDRLTVTGTGTTETLTYQLKAGANGTAIVTVMVNDGGGTANGGVDTYSRTFVITVNALPVLSINSDKGTKISKGETVFLNATGGATYVWATDSSIITGGSSATLEVRPRQTTTYTVTGTNASGCVETKSFTITVLDDMEKIKATNILTPNGDGFNDTWIIDNIDFYPNNEVKVFDKTGRLMFAKKGYDNSWDGTFNGTALTEGTYYYVIDFGTGKQVFKGYITIIKAN